MSRLNLGAIDYINSLPLFGGVLKNQIDLSSHLVLDHPQNLNKQLIAETLDLSFVSSVTYLRNKERFSMIPQFCIASKRKIQSVKLYHNKEIKELSGEKIGLFSHSASSVELLKVLCRDYWSIDPLFVPIDSVEEGKKLPAFLLIGDPCLIHPTIAGYQSVDLAEEWFIKTGFPFVFALLVFRNNLLNIQQLQIAKICEEIETSYQWGKDHRASIIALAEEKSPLSPEQISSYFSLLSYRTDPQILRSLDFFEKHLQNSPAIGIAQ